MTNNLKAKDLEETTQQFKVLGESISIVKCLETPSIL